MDGDVERVSESGDLPEPIEDGPDVGLLVWSAFTFGLLVVGGVWWAVAQLL